MYPGTPFRGATPSEIYETLLFAVVCNLIFFRRVAGDCVGHVRHVAHRHADDTCGRCDHLVRDGRRFFARVTMSFIPHLTFVPLPTFALAVSRARLGRRRWCPRWRPRWSPNFPKMQRSRAIFPILTLHAMLRIKLDVRDVVGCLLRAQFRTSFVRSPAGARTQKGARGAGARGGTKGAPMNCLLTGMLGIARHFLISDNFLGLQKPV